MQNNELKQYINLSNHLSEKLQNEPYINENLITSMLPNGTKKQFEAVKRMFSSIGGFWSKLISGSSESETDPIAEEMERQEEEAEKTDKEREEAWAKSEEALEVARLQAQFEREQNQKKLAFERRKRAVDAQAAKLARAANSWKTNKIEYTIEELNGFAEEERKAYNQVAPLIVNTDLNELNDLMYEVCYDEDANPLTLQQIKDKARTNEAFNKQFNRFKDLIKKRKGVIIDSMQDEQFKKTVLNNAHAEAIARENAETDKDNAETALNDFNIIANKVAEYKEKQQKHDEAEAKVTSLENKIKAFKAAGKWNGGDLEIYTVDNEGNVTVKADRTTLVAAYADKSLGKKDDGSFDIGTYIAALRAKGIPEAVTTKIEEKYDGSQFNSDNLRNMLEAVIDDNDMDSIKESMKNKLKGEYDDLSSQLESATQEKDALGQMPKPEDMEVTVTENGEKVTYRLSDIDMAAYDTTTTIGEGNKAKAEDDYEQAKSNLAEVERRKAVAKMRRKEAIERTKARNETQTPQEFKNAVDEINQGLQPGEEVRTIEVNGVKKEVAGYVDPGTNEFKHNPGRKSDKYNEYIENRNAALLKMTPKEPNRITKQDGKYYINGEEVTGTEEQIKQKVAEAYAQNERRAETATEILAVKSKAAAKVAACIKDGKFDREKFDSLKPVEQALVRAVVNMTEEERKTAFADVDLYGTEKTLSSIKKAIGGTDSETKIKDELSAEDIKSEDIANGDVFDGTPEGGETVKYGKDNDGNFYKQVGNTTTKMTFNEWIDAVEQDKKASSAMAVEFENDTTLADDDFRAGDHDKNNDDNDETGRKRTNPRKIWKRYKYKRGNKTKVSKRTYVNKKGDRISRDEFDKRCASYDRFKADNPDRVIDSLIYVNLGNHLFDSIGNTTNKYSKLRDCILNKLNS
jgi:hypothetical protein